VTESSDGTVRIEVVAGGEPTAEEFAALVVALAPVEVTEVPSSPASPWRRAALHDGVGARPATCPADVDLI
jgi:hypothetical protein